MNKPIDNKSKSGCTYCGGTGYVEERAVDGLLDVVRCSCNKPQSQKKAECQYCGGKCDARIGGKCYVRRETFSGTRRLCDCELQKERKRSKALVKVAEDYVADIGKIRAENFGYAHFSSFYSRFKKALEKYNLKQ